MTGPKRRELIDVGLLCYVYTHRAGAAMACLAQDPPVAGAFSSRARCRSARMISGVRGSPRQYPPR